MIGIRLDQFLKESMKKVTYQKSDCLPYLGMTILKTFNGFKICMQSYIDEENMWCQLSRTCSISKDEAIQQGGERLCGAS
jgi:hypothetical protein